MPQDIICQMKSYIQPFERCLAIRELKALSNCESISQTDGTKDIWMTKSSIPIVGLADKLTYWEWVGNKNRVYITTQVKREATADIVRNGIKLKEIEKLLPFREKIPLPKRRVLRYGPHGIHEYRGKFFPQLVRSLLNSQKISRSSIVLDPMCGSGTTPVEASLLGSRAYGVDLNPLSALISKTKCSILNCDRSFLISEYEFLKEHVEKQQIQRSGADLSWFDSLPKKDRDYLSSWLSTQVIRNLDPIMCRIHEVEDQAIKNLFLLSISNILRKVSWQKEDELRVRRTKSQNVNIDVTSEFLIELSRSVRLVLAFIIENKDSNIGETTIAEGDARNISEFFPELQNNVDTIVTSPPYAMALPYIDTDRLSLIYLGLLPRSEHRKREFLMIGNREVTEKQRLEYWLEYKENEDILPAEVITIIDKLNELNNSTIVGFRRRNLPALLAHYFIEMRYVLEEIQILLKKGAYAFMVVGNNHTKTDGKRINITTDKFLGLIGESVGLNLVETIPMEMLISRDIFRKNTCLSESILCFKKAN